MKETNFVTNALKVWQEGGCDRGADVAHLDEDILFRLACAAGLEDASEQEITHLAGCGQCRKEWCRWQEAIVDADEVAADNDRWDLADEPVLGWGGLKAAAASLFVEPVSLLSECGRFELSLFPDVDVADSGLIVIEVMHDQALFEGRSCVVRDGNGMVLIQGKIEDGRCAGRGASLYSFALQTWTVQLDSVS